jgi:SAM-dependent methyltransferase
MTLDEQARRAAKAEAQARIDAASADLARGAIAEAVWQQRAADALATAYLSDDDPRWQSGFDGDPELWREARALVLDAVPANGSFLDVGCANGFLMECLASWARARGLELSPYGLELNPQLADTARRRLPAWADRIYTGNVSDWRPPRRFTYARTGLEYVPPGSEAALIVRLLRDVLEPGGRLLVGPIADADVSATISAFASAGVLDPCVVSGADRNGKARHVVWAGADVGPTDAIVFAP